MSVAHADITATVWIAITSRRSSTARALPKPPLVLVVGMPRSGLSLLRDLLAGLGLSVMDAGCAEQLVAIQDRLLIDLERWWPSRQATQALPEDWLEQPATGHARERLQALLTQDAERHAQAWVITDPRGSRLLPLWIQLAEALQRPLQLLLCVRDPAEVHAALQRSGGDAAGISLNHAQQLWWRHNLGLIQDARTAGVPLEVIDFEAWFTQPQAALEQLCSLLPCSEPSPTQREQALALIQPERRGPQLEHARRGLDPAVRRLHRRLLQWPLPTRWPASTPPSRLEQGNDPLLQGEALASQPQCWPEWLERHRDHPAPQLAELPPLAEAFRVELCGANWMEWEPHLLMQRLPLSGLEQLVLDRQNSAGHQLVFQRPEGTGPLQQLLINLELPPLERRAQWLGHLRAQPLVLDPDPARVLLLRACGLSVGWLDPEGPVNGWLQQPAALDPGAWAQHLGLAAPQPQALIVLGHAGPVFDRALALESQRGASPQPAIHYAPGWPQLTPFDAPSGLARAGWLQAAARVGARLVHAADGPLPELWSRLAQGPAAPCSLPPSAAPADLRALHQGTPLRALAQERTSPPQETAFHWCNGQAPAAAVVVSLFNYADRITAALDSVAAQTSQQLELIVVDDASTDAGVEQVKAWMQAQLQNPGHGFGRLLLLSHQANAGLAAARNTAFRAARAPWCFVLDADNALYPEAVSACLGLAQGGGDALAVVHPLLAVEAEPGRADDARSLVGTLSWLREHFLAGNVVDAMALVRRSAWEAAGGYTHIEGGWEDFDFWCKLLEAGFHGVQCPRILAVYRSHDQSMSHTATNSHWRALSRTLQDRHPWLALPLASP